MMSTKDMAKILACRWDIRFLVDCLLGNPNGDPDAGNLPRTIPFDDELGLISDGCQKAVVRKWMTMMKMKTYIQQETNLNRILAEHAEEHSIPLSPSERSRDEDSKAQQTFVRKYADARIFGACLGSGPNFGQITGPAQIMPALSVDPVNVIDMGITRSCKSEDKDGRRELITAEDYREWEGRQNKASLRTMGRKAIIHYGLFKGTAYVSPFRAAQTGMTEEDLEFLLEALEHGFEANRTASKGMMACRGIVAFKHVGTGPDNEDRKRQAMKGCAHSHDLFKLVKVSKKDGVESPKRWEDYEVQFEASKVPEGVEHRLICANDWIVK